MYFPEAAGHPPTSSDLERVALWVRVHLRRNSTRKSFFVCCARGITVQLQLSVTKVLVLSSSLSIESIFLRIRCASYLLISYQHIISTETPKKLNSCKLKVGKDLSSNWACC